MSDLQGEASETEQPSLESERSSHKADLWSIITAFGISFYIGWRIIDLMDDDIIRAHLLRALTRFFARTARYMGEQALLAEQLYYDTVRANH